MSLFNESEFLGLLEVGRDQNDRNRLRRPRILLARSMIEPFYTSSPYYLSQSHDLGEEIFHERR